MDKASSRKHFYFKGIILFFAGSLLLYYGAYFFWLFCIFLVWLIPSKKQPIFNERVKHFRDHKFRLVVSGILVIFSLISLVNSFYDSHKASVGQQKIEQAEKDQAEFLATIPDPIIKVLSSTEPQGQKRNYILKLAVEGANEVLINSEAIEIKSPQTLEKSIELKESSTTINILAKNDHKETKESLTIIRDLTNQEEYGDTIDQFNRELESLKSFNPSVYRTGIDQIMIELVLFKGWGDLIAKGKESESEEVKGLTRKLEKRVKDLQSKEFPAMRKAYVEVLDKKLWEHDIEVFYSGNSNNYIEFVGGMFASNKNIKDFHSQVQEMVSELRFDQISFKWFSLQDDYQYIDLESLSDSEITGLK